MRRGDLVVVAQKGFYEGKPRPALVIQADALLGTHPSVLVCQISADPGSATGAFYRIAVSPTSGNGLREPSTILVDRVVTIARGNIRGGVGRVDEATLARVNRALALVQGLL